MSEDDENRNRFLMELEFVQSLANPMYLKYLAQNQYFSDPAFINYLKYLLYWQKPEYVKYIKYPQCLHFLVLLQEESFRKQIGDTGFANYVYEQQLSHWKLYRKNRIEQKEENISEENNNKMDVDI